MGEIEKTEARAANASKGTPRAKIRRATRADAAELQAIYAYYVENTTVSFEYEAPSVAEMERRVAEVEDVYPFLVCVVEENGEDAQSFSAAELGNAGAAKNIAVASNKENARDGATAANGKNREDEATLPPDANVADVEKGKTGGERIVGYALAHRAFERAAYSWVAETSVYVDRNWRRRGIGEALYSALIEILEAQGVRALYAVVVAENQASVDFHRRAGYRDFATFKNAGWKFGRWLDVVWLERTLGARREAGESEAPPTPVRPLAELTEMRTIIEMERSSARRDCSPLTKKKRTL